MKELKVEGMSCQHCVAAVTKACEAVDGVSDVKVDLLGKKVSFNGPDEAVAAITANIEKAGFEVPA